MFPFFGVMLPIQSISLFAHNVISVGQSREQVKLIQILYTLLDGGL